MVCSLESLLLNKELKAEMGKAFRNRVINRYSVAATWDSFLICLLHRNKHFLSKQFPGLKDSLTELQIHLEKYLYNVYITISLL